MKSLFRVLSTSIAPIIVFVMGVAGTTVGAVAAAQPPPVSTDSEEPALALRLDRIWGYATLHENADHPVLEKFELKGRFQVDFPLYDSNHGGDYDDPQVRRLRLGFKSQWLADITVHAEVDIDVECDEGEDCDGDRYQGLTDAYVGWSPDDAFALKLGKISAPFSLDGTTSSTRLISLERNNVSNNLWFPTEYHAGIGASGRIEQSRYQIGVYSSSTDKEFGEFDGAYFTLVTLVYDFSKQFDLPEFLLSFNYVYNKSDADNIATRDLSHVISLHVRFDTGAWGLRSELTGGVGYRSQSDLIGFALMPFYNLTENVQLVVRYIFLHSFDDPGIRYSRYESRIESAPGDEYDEVFLGLNWFIYGHKLKLQTGLKHTWMDAERDYRGWGWTTGLRISW